MNGPLATVTPAPSWFCTCTGEPATPTSRPSTTNVDLPTGDAPDDREADGEASAPATRRERPT
jgi:hypothetical protein